MSYIGCLVSLNCGDVLGTYQGKVKRIDNSSQSLTITQPFRNGVKCEFPEVTFSACDIKELKIVKTAEDAAKQLPKNVTPSKLSKNVEKELNSVASPGRVVEAKSENGTGAQYVNGNGTRDRCVNRYDGGHTPTKDRRGSEELLNGFVSPVRNRTQSTNSMGPRNGANRDRYEDSSNTTRNGARQTPTHDEQFRSRRNSASEGRNHKSSVPRKIEFRKKSQSRQDCFSAPVDSILDDFDFEKNLALFDKKAVFEEIESSNPDIAKVSDKRQAKYRCDENVLQSEPVMLQQIKIPKMCGRTYVTDSGLVVPSIDYDLRNKILDMAEANGFTADRRLEMIGRSSSEMVLQLLGGGSRINPQNGHQLPVVLILCGPHIQGAQGLNCARHLVNHGVKTIVFLPNFLRMVQSVELELSMYDCCNGKRYSDIQDIPDCSIDMIVNCLDSHENSFLKDQAWYQTHVQWVSQCRAPILSIDPPIETVDIVSKWCLYPILPLAIMDTAPQVYLCDIGLPKKVFRQVGITYRSPFGHKFVVALHIKT